MSDRKLTVRIIGDDSSLSRAFTRSSHASNRFGSDISKTTRGVLAATVSMRGLGRALTFGSAQFLGGAGVAFALKQIVTEASRVQEEIEKTGVVFGRNAGQVQAWSKTLAQSFGVSEGAALQAAGTFGNMLRPLGFGEQAAAAMSERLVQLAADMASFNNIKPAEALQALSGGLAGQVRPLRALGVFLSQARIQTEAYAAGIAKHGAKLTQAQKVQAAYNIILKDTRLQQGDVARNTGSLSVAMSKLTAGVQDLEAGLGTALLPALTEYVNKAAAWLNQTKNQQRIQHDFREALADTTAVLRGIKDVIKTVDQITGSFKHTVELLIGLKVASTLRNWTKALVGLEIAAGAGGAGGAAKSVTTLGTALRRLTQIGVISIAFKFPGLAAGLSRIATLTKLLKVGALGDVLTILSTPNAQGGPTSTPQTDTAKQVLAIIGKLSGKVRSDIVQSAQAVAPTKADTLGQLVNDPTFRKAIVDELIRRGLIVSTKTSATTGLGPHHDTSFGPSITAATTAATSAARTGLTAGQKNTFFDNAIARILLRGGIGNIQQQIAALRRADTLIAARLLVTKDVTRKLNLEDQLLQNQASISDLKAQSAADALQKAADAQQKRQDAFAEFISGLQLRLTKAQATATFKDDLAALKGLQDGIRKQIAEFGKTADLEGQLFDVQQQIKDTRQKQRDAAQFFTLGLGPTGDTKVPLVKSLQKQLANVSESVSGTFLDTKKTRSVLANIKKVLSAGIGNVSAEVRSKIKEMLDGINKDIGNHARNLTKFAHVNSNAIVAAVGGDLTPEQKRRLRAAISTIGAGGTVPGVRPGAFAGAQTTTTVHTTVNLDGRVIADVVTPHQQKKQQRRSGSRRGPYAGRH